MTESELLTQARDALISYARGDDESARVFIDAMAELYERNYQAAYQQIAGVSND